jgi:VWFA-related protein
MPTRRSPYFLKIAAIVVLGLFVSLALSQEKPKLKDFGSSLERLKWDPKLNAAVDKGPREKAKTSISEDVVRVETSLVSSDLLVLDTHGQQVKGLSNQDFLITEDGKQQNVGMFALDGATSIGRSIVLIIDYSGSLFRYVDMSVDAAKILVDQLGPRDRMAVVTDEIKLLTGFTQDKDKLKSKLESLKKQARSHDARGGWFRGHSNQFSALMATLRELFTAEDERPVVVFQTDGDELLLMQPRPTGLPQSMNALTRQFSVDDVYKAAEKSKATIYTVIPGIKLLGISSAELEERLAPAREEAVAALTRGGRGLSDQKKQAMFQQQIHTMVNQQSVLAILATITGGWTEFLEEPSQANEIYSRIVSDLNARYIVGYYPTNKAHDGKKRKVSFTIRDHPEYAVMGRKAYYAPGPDQ